jgi:anthranilate phosphoribosyltransferase
VHSEDGLDEITVTGKTLISEVSNGKVNSYTITPGYVGLPVANLDDLKGGTAAENASLLRDVLSGKTGHASDAVLLNAAGALKAAERVETLTEGVQLARTSIESHQALDKLNALVDLTQQFK